MSDEISFPEYLLSPPAIDQWVNYDSDYILKHAMAMEDCSLNTTNLHNYMVYRAAAEFYFQLAVMLEARERECKGLT